jgi:serine/threonine protein kinase/CheY-like chemotaxis protein
MLTKKHTILVIDDEPDLIQSVQEMLRLDYQVLGATRAVDGLRILEREPVQIVMTDQRMPEMSGVEFLKILRESYPDVTRLLFTAYADIEAVTDAINQGNVYRYISKPWEPHELLQVLRQAVEYYDMRVERKRLTEELREKNQQLEQTNGQLHKLTEQLIEVNGELLKSVRKGKQQLGNYQLLEKLNRQGGMGTVYKALHILLMKLVALKVLAANRIDNPEAVARFHREMKAVGRLNHPNIVHATDAGEDNGTFYLVMEFVDGTDLATLIERRGSFPVREACELVRQAAIALQHAHEHGLVHRDVKPSNLMVTPLGLVKLLDLGLARLCDGPRTDEMLTAPGHIVGTADYIAPEQASGTQPVDIRADLYSLGCTLYHLLSGRPPFGGPEFPGAMKKLLAHTQTPVPPIQQFRPEVEIELAAVLNRLLAKSPGGRFDTPAELASVLERFSAGADLTALCRVTTPEAGPDPGQPTESYGPSS